MSFFIKNTTGSTRFQILIYHVLTIKNETDIILSATGLIFTTFNATGLHREWYSHADPSGPQELSQPYWFGANPRAQSMTAFESSLERDFFLLLDFDPNVEFFEEQPVKISYSDTNGCRRTYTPDVLVCYLNDSPQAKHTKPLLCEVKYRDDLRQHWAEYHPKFRAAGRYAHQQGWRFRLVIERHVRTQYLENVKFLRPYRTLPVNDSYRTQLLITLATLEATDPSSLLAAVFKDGWQQAQLLLMLWQLVTTRQIGADLEQPLTMQSGLWLQKT